VGIPAAGRSQAVAPDIPPAVAKRIASFMQSSTTSRFQSSESTWQLWHARLMIEWSHQRLRRSCNPVSGHGNEWNGSPDWSPGRATAALLAGQRTATYGGVELQPHKPCRLSYKMQDCDGRGDSAERGAGPGEAGPRRSGLDRKKVTTMRQHNVVQSRVSSERSWMLVNGNRPDVLDDAASASADQISVGIDHLSTINTLMSPTSADLIWAAEFLADFESRGSVIRDGSDPPRLGRARALIEHARALGIQSV
jgi:hypothetical protein